MVRYGTGIALMAIGAILIWAVSDKVPNVNLPMIGWILLGAGALTFVVSLIMASMAGRRRETIVEHRDTGAGPSEYRQERDVRGEPPAQV